MTSPAPAAAAVDFRALAEAFWQDFLRHSPTFATRIGDRRFDDRLEDISGPARNARIASLRATIEAAVALEGDDLGPVDRVSRSMLIEEATGQLLALETRVDEWSVNPIDGPQTWVVDIVDDQAIETVEDGRRLVARAQAVGVYMDQAIDALRRGMARGCVASVTPLERVIEEVRLLVDVPAESWRLATPARHEHAGWDAGDLARFRTALVDAIERIVIPAFGRYLDVLEQEILPVARPSDRAGLLHVPDGEAIYRALARSHTGLDIEPRTIHEIGLRDIERIDEAFEDLGARVLGVHGLEATLAALQSNPAFRFGGADEVFETAARTVARAEAAVPAWFGRLPAVSCEVWRIPAESAAHQTLAYYAWPTLDGTRPGRYYINLHAPETRPRYEAEALAFHEAVPGHHLQMALAAELRNLPTFQRMLGSNAFAEGWALYAERLADEMGLYSSDMDRFGILSFDAWRASRLVVDTGLHAMGWTRDQAIAFMREHTALDDGNIANEVDRYIAWPGQALAYKLGQLEILRLRARAEAALGDRFDIRAFHDAVLGSGAVGLATLAGIVEDWIASASPRA
ncbi:MAG: DUF885 domain-containing protein [Chloroflexi bacterium]|nr:DUF885 domain-containing protein [Chloroflexota bacterium]